MWASLPAARKRTSLINYPTSRLIHSASRCRLCRVSSTPRQRMTPSHQRSKNRGEVGSLSMSCCDGTFLFFSSRSIINCARRIAKSFSLVAVFPVRAVSPIVNRQIQTSSRSDERSTLNSTPRCRIPADTSSGRDCDSDQRDGNQTNHNDGYAIHEVVCHGTYPTFTSLGIVHQTVDIGMCNLCQAAKGYDSRLIGKTG